MAMSNPALRTEAPLIAINGTLELDAPRAPKLTLRTPYAERVAAAGGVPVAIPPVGGPRDLRRLLERVDGLLLGGGDDFDMERLGLGATHPAACKTPAQKQDFDVELARIALELEIPVLGICYGMQTLVLCDGGTLLQHLPEDRPGCQEHAGGALHAVRVEPRTKLARLLGIDAVQVVSRHHQAVDETGPRWIVCARDAEGLVEAVERPDHPFALGVQWHPELAPPGDPCDRLFRGLVGAAGVGAARRELPPVRALP